MHQLPHLIVAYIILFDTMLYKKNMVKLSMNITRFPVGNFWHPYNISKLHEPMNNYDLLVSGGVIFGFSLKWLQWVTQFAYTIYMGTITMSKILHPCCLELCLTICCNVSKRMRPSLTSFTSLRFNWLSLSFKWNLGMTYGPLAMLFWQISFICI